MFSAYHYVFATTRRTGASVRSLTRSRCIGVSLVTSRPESPVRTFLRGAAVSANEASAHSASTWRYLPAKRAGRTFLRGAAVSAIPGDSAQTGPTAKVREFRATQRKPAKPQLSDHSAQNRRSPKHHARRAKPTFPRHRRRCRGRRRPPGTFTRSPAVAPPPSPARQVAQLPPLSLFRRLPSSAAPKTFLSLRLRSRQTLTFHPSTTFSRQSTPSTFSPRVPSLLPFPISHQPTPPVTPSSPSLPDHAAHPFSGPFQDPHSPPFHPSREHPVFSHSTPPPSPPFSARR